MHRSIMLFFLLIILSFPCLAEQDFYTAVKGDSVFIFLTETPAVGQRVIVERRGPDTVDFETLTTTPIEPVLSAEEAQRILGNDAAAISRTLESDNIQQTLFLLRNDSFRGGIFTMINRKVGRILGRFFAAGGHEPNASYQYRASIINRRGEIVRSIEKKVDIIEFIPEPPEDLKTRTVPQGILLTWTYPEWKSGTRDLTVQFYCYRKVNGTKFQRISDRIFLRLEGVSLLYLDTHVSPKDSLTYYLTAVNAAGLESPPSIQVAAVFQDLVPPSSPQGLKTLVQNGTVELIWSLSPELDVAHYNVYRATGTTDPLQRINAKPIAAEDAFYTDNSCEEGKQVFYAVSAVDSSGNESRPSNRIDAWLEDRTPPGRPSGLKAKVHENRIHLSWQAPPDKDLRGFHLYRGLTPDQIFRQTETIIPESDYTDSGPEGSGFKPGRKYYYAIEAVDSMFNRSEPSSVWISVPDNEPPYPPGDIQSSFGQGQILFLTWDPSPSLDIKSYVLSRISDQGKIVLDTTERNRLQFTDTTVVKGNRYGYEVVGVDTAGNVSEPRSSGMILVRDFTPPHYPRFVQAAVDGNRVRIRWEKVVASDLAGYNVYRSNLETGVFKKINEQEITDLEYIDPQGTNNNWYRIKTVDTSGNESDPSKPVSP